MKKFIVLFLFCCVGYFAFSYAEEENLENAFICKRNEQSNEKASRKVGDYSDSKQKDNEGKESEVGLSFAIKGAYFWPQDSTYRDVYGDGGFSPLVEVCYKIYKGLGTWLECGFFYKSDHVTSVDLRAKTNIVQVPLSAGLSYTYPACSFLDIYAKIGPNWMYTKTWVDIPGIQKTVIKNTFGGTFGVGGKFKLSKHWFAELFLNYLYDKKKIKSAEETFSTYVGGIQTGVGIGYSF